MSAENPTGTTRKQRRLKYGLSSAAAVLILGGILVALNVIGSRLFLRADLTEQKEFTVSHATKDVLRGLEDVVSVKVFFSKKVPPQLATLRQQVEDLLKEYRVYSNGKVQVRIFDPGESPELAQEAQSLGIAQVQMNLLERDQFQVTNVFMGLGVQFGDKREAIPFIQDASTLEYDLTSALLKVTRTEEKVVGFLAGNQEKPLNQDYEGIRQELARQYTVRPIDLSGGRTAVPPDVNTLVVAGSRSVPERVRYELDQFLMRGGRLVLLLDSITMNEQMGLQAYPSTSGLEDLISHYGVGIRSALVLDPRNSTATFAQGYMQFMIPYPFWPRVVKPDLDPQNPITARLESVVFPWAAPLDVHVPVAGAGGGPAAAKGDGEDGPDADGGAGGSGSSQPEVTAAILARTTNKAALASGRYDLNPQTAMANATPPTGEQYPLAVALTGSFRSYFADRPVPPAPGDTTAAGPAGLAQSPLTQVIVVGNSQFCTNLFLRNFPENALFLQNAIDWMTMGSELIAIRSRGATARPIREVAEGTRTLIKILLTAGIPLLVVAAGLGRAAIRRRQRARLVEAYRPAR